MERGKLCFLKSEPDKDCNEKKLETPIMLSYLFLIESKVKRNSPINKIVPKRNLKYFRKPKKLKETSKTKSPRRWLFFAIKKISAIEKKRLKANINLVLMEFVLLIKIIGPAERRISNTPAGRGFLENK